MPNNNVVNMSSDVAVALGVRFNASVSHAARVVDVKFLDDGSMRIGLLVQVPGTDSEVPLYRDYQVSTPAAVGLLQRPLGGRDPEPGMSVWAALCVENVWNGRPWVSVSSLRLRAESRA